MWKRYGFHRYWGRWDQIRLKYINLQKFDLYVGSYERYWRDSFRFLCLWIHAFKVIPSYRHTLMFVVSQHCFFLHWNVAPNFPEPLHRVLRCSADWRSNWRGSTGRSSWLPREWLATSEATGGAIVRNADAYESNELLDKPIEFIFIYHCIIMIWLDITDLYKEKVYLCTRINSKRYLTWNHRDSLWANLAEVWLWRHFSSLLWCGRWWWIGG